MKPPAFEYVRPTTVADAIAALVAYDGEAKIIAGGQSLVPVMNFRLLAPKALVDINSIAGLDFIAETTEGGLRIGALVRHYRLMTAPEVRASFPIVAEAMRHVAHLAIRNRGTIGGSLSHADPSAELPMMAVLLDATIRVVGPNGTRNIAAADFFQGALATALAKDELLTEVVLPPPSCAGWGFHEFAHRAGDFALAAAGVTLAIVDGRAADVRLAVAGVGETPSRVSSAEAVLDGYPIDPERIAAVAAAVRAAVTPGNDLHGSAEYRRHLVGGLVGRAVEDAWRRAQNQPREHA